MKSGVYAPAFYFTPSFKKGVLTLDFVLMVNYLGKKIVMIQTTSPTQSQFDKLKRQNKRMRMGIGALSLSTIIAIILWFLGLNPIAKPFYEVEIDTNKFKLGDSVAKFRTDMSPFTKTYLIGYKANSIVSYHATKFQSIINSSGITIPSPSPSPGVNLSWETVYYLMIKDGNMALAIMPSIVEKNASDSIIKVFDYFDPTTFRTTYQSKSLAAYDFGHLEP